MNPGKNNEFDRQLANKFDSFRPKVSNDLWGKIASELDEQGQEQSGTATAPQQQRFRTWWLSVAASALIVCGTVYWYTRPVAVTYLHNPIVQAEETGMPAVAEPAPKPTPAVEPLDVDRLRQLFAKRNRQAKSENQQEAKVAEAPAAGRPGKAIGSQPAVTEAAVTPMQVVARKDDPTSPPTAERSATAEALVATVPDIQPPVVLEDEEETLLAATEATKQPFGVSNILNYVVGAVDQREEKLVTFSNDDEGSLKLDFNFSLVKNKKKRIK